MWSFFVGSELYMQLLIIFSIVTTNISLKTTVPEEQLSVYGVLNIPDDFWVWL